MIQRGNIFSDLRTAGAGEETVTLARRPGVVVERIVSTGQATPQGYWYDQDWTEWVVVLSGRAELLIAGEDQPTTLGPGDWIELPEHARHRVEWTDPSRPTVWLAVHAKD